MNLKDIIQDKQLVMKERLSKIRGTGGKKLLEKSL